MFEEELESYKQAMEKRKADHAAAIERQRQELAARMQELQTKQNQVFQNSNQAESGFPKIKPSRIKFSKIQTK